MTRRGLKLDGFRGIANTVRGRMLSKNGHRLRRFEPLLDRITGSARII